MERPRQLPSGKWQARVTGPDGTRISAGVHTSLRKAQQAQAMKLAELEKAVPDPTSTAFDTYAEAWLYSRRPGQVGGYAPTSYRKAQAALRTALVPTFGAMDVEEITPRHVRAWWDQNGDAPSRRQSLYYLLKGILGQAMEDELIERNPARIRGAGKDPSKERPTFLDTDVAKLHAAATDPTMRALITFLVGSGARLGEALGLDWSDISLFDAQVSVVKHFTPYGMAPGTKTGTDKTRTLALPTWATQALEELYAASDGEGAIFRSAYGGRMSVDVAERRFRTIREAAGLPLIHVHDLRHVALSNYARQPGVTIRDVMARGGHATERMALRYQHTDTSRDHAFVAALPNPLEVA